MIAWIRNLLKQKFIRFLIAGGVNTLFSFISFSVLMFLLENKELAVTWNLFVAVFFNYNTSARFVFKEKSMTLKQVLKFYMVYFLTYPLNLLHLHFTVDVWNWNVYLSQFTTLLYMPLLSFLLQRKLVFAPNKL